MEARLDARKSIVELSATDLADALRAIGEPAFRAKQIRRWVLQERVTDFALMTDLPVPLRERLAASMDALPLALVEEVVSADGLTRKALLGLADGAAIETVFMEYPAATAPGSSREPDSGEMGDPADPPRLPVGRDRPASSARSLAHANKPEIARRTVCVSSQVGCAIGCPFCATGASGFVRDLSAAEIAAQVLYYAAWTRESAGPEARVTNVVLMGQGEPLANLPAVRAAIEMLNAADGFGLGARHVTLSTAGLVPGIRELAEWPLQVGLAISLHAPDDVLRDRLVPVNRRYPLAELIPACADYAAVTGRRVSFEYAMISGLNDSPERADRLADLLGGMLAHVNLIPLNPVDESPFQPSARGRVLEFQARLARRGIACTVRASRGDPIAAACGQLRARRAVARPMESANGR